MNGQASLVVFTLLIRDGEHIHGSVTGEAHAGYTYWARVLNGKAASRSDLFVHFSESTFQSQAENKNATKPIVTKGVE